MSSIRAFSPIGLPTIPTGCLKPSTSGSSLSFCYYVNLLRVRKSGVLSRHRHSGPVHALVLRGRWYDLEHDWVAEEGGNAFEPAGETHTLFVPEDLPEMIRWFHVTGGYTYVDPQGVATGYEDVFTKLEAATKHYQLQGFAPDHIQRIVR
jgi:2,4'-dihydroxyacetophenone dioxygenase